MNSMIDLLIIKLLFIHSLFTIEKLEDNFIKLTKYYQDDIESRNEAILNAEYKLCKGVYKI